MTDCVANDRWIRDIFGFRLITIAACLAFSAGLLGTPDTAFADEIAVRAHSSELKWRRPDIEAKLNRKLHKINSGPGTKAQKQQKMKERFDKAISKAETDFAATRKFGTYLQIFRAGRVLGILKSYKSAFFGGPTTDKQVREKEKELRKAAKKAPPKAKPATSTVKMWYPKKRKPPTLNKVEFECTRYVCTKRVVKYPVINIGKDSGPVRPVTEAKPPASASSTDRKTGITTKSVKNPDGTRTVTTTDKDGKVLSEEVVGKSPASASSTDKKTGITTKSVKNTDGTRTVTTTDKDGKVLSEEVVGKSPASASSTDRKTGITTKSVKNTDGTRTVTTTDKDGKVLSEEKVR